MTKISKLDWEIIDNRVTEAKNKSNYPTKSIALLSIILKQIFPDIQDQLLEAITDGTDDQGIDGIHIVEREKSAEVFLFQSKYRENHNSCSKTINDNEVIKISYFLTMLFEKCEKLIQHNNHPLIEAIKRIWDIHAKGSYCKYNVIFCSNGNGLSESANKICETLTESKPQVSFEFFGGQQILNGMYLEGRSHENGTLKVFGKEILERSDGDVRGVIASIDANSFVDLITNNDGKTVKRHIFDDNLRVFLGSKGGYNPNIIKTATSDNNYLFWYLNNGITITCKSFNYNKGHTSPIINFNNFQIVNGAQTSHSLIEARRENSKCLNDVVLMVRIYATDREDIVEKVAVATNSQARIQARDLKSNSDILKKLELGLKEKGYFLERKRNAYKGKRPEKVIDPFKLGQIILSFELREPDKAKTESDSIFSDRFDAIFNNGLDISHLISVFELYRIIENKREEYKSKNESKRLIGENNKYLVYGHWFILFACKLLIIRDKINVIPTGKKAEELIAEAITLVA